jgi:DNA-binding response OmpR family regulator
MAKKVLIVEDEVTLRRILEQKFKQEGFEVFTAQDGEEGLTQFQAHAPDIILVDIIMPRMDGMTMLARLRENPKNNNVPVMLLTNLSDGQKVDEGIRHGVYDYLVKSDWRLEDVVRKVRERLEI